MNALRWLVSHSLAMSLAFTAAVAPLRAQETEGLPPPDREAMGLDSLLVQLRALEDTLAGDPSNPALAYRRLGALYLVGVHEKRAVENGLAALDSLDLLPGPAADTALSLAYRGAFRVLLGKHAFWPHSKLSHVRNGLSLLDRAVEIEPASARVRYLRLMSGYYLPGLFRRGDEVRADFAALASLLPGAQPEFPPRLYAEVCRFVLENGELSGPEQALLSDSSASVQEDGGEPDGR